MEISFGKQYLFPLGVVFVLCLNFYVTGMRQATLVFRDSLGLFWFDRYKSVIGAVLNLGISIVLARQYGTIGVFLGTLISALLTSFWVEPWILYRHSLGIPVRKYFRRYFLYALVTGVAGYLTNYLCRFTSGNVWKILILRLVICIVVPNVIFFICYVRVPEFQFLFRKFKGLLSKRNRREHV